MSGVRKVTAASPSANKAKIYETDAKTWGELKSVVKELLVGDVEAIVNPGNVTLRGDDSVLPEGDFKLYLVASKNKAGNVSPEAAQQLAERIGKAIVAAAAKASDDDVKQLENDLISEIENFFNVELGEDEVDCAGCADALREARDLE